MELAGECNGLPIIRYLAFRSTGSGEHSAQVRTDAEAAIGESQGFYQIPTVTEP